MDITINISDHPNMPEVKRRVTYDSISISNSRKMVVLNVVVDHYNDQGVDLSDTIKSKTVQLIASNKYRVDNNGDLITERYVRDQDGKMTYDQQGKPVETDEWKNGTPEWDYLDNIAKSGNLDIYALIQSTINSRASSGRFNNIY